jgi:heme O synthase-like polyprenyltransferase
MPWRDYAALYGAGALADFFSAIGWINAAVFVISPVFGIAFLWGSEDRYGHQVVTPERHHQAMICFAIPVVYLSLLIAFWVIRHFIHRFRDHDIGLR